MTPADLLVASMAAEPFHPHTCIQALLGLESRIKRATASQHLTDYEDHEKLTDRATSARLLRTFIEAKAFLILVGSQYC